MVQFKLTISSQRVHTPSFSQLEDAVVTVLCGEISDHMRAIDMGKVPPTLDLFYSDDHPGSALLRYEGCPQSQRAPAKTATVLPMEILPLTASMNPGESISVR